MVQTTKELPVAITPIDDAEVHAFVEYLEWMKSANDTILTASMLSDPEDSPPVSNDKAA